jgi:RNA polymerase sigma factor (sigma-70 family)
MDDTELLRRYADEKSDQAFRELVQRHLPVVHAAALRQVHGDAHLAQDVAQRVFVALAQKARSLRGQRTLVGWLYTAARLEGARAIRTEMRRRRREETAAAMETNESPAASDAPLHLVLDEAMTELGGGEREAVLLRFFAGQSFGEIGRVLEISEEAARKRVDRAVEKLHTNLTRRGVTSTASALAAALSAYAAPAVSPTLTAAVTAGVSQQLAAGSAVPLALFMSSSKAVVIAAGVLALAGGFIVYDRSIVRDAEEQRRRAEANLAAASDRQAKLTAQLAGLQHEITEAEKPVPAAPPPRAPGAAPAYLTNPDFRQLVRASTKARWHLEFQRLYRQLNLSAAQIEQFEAFMTRQDEAYIDAALVRADGGDEQTVFKRSGAEWSQAMRDLLGEGGFTQLKDYLRARPVRAFVDNFAVQSAATGTGLTAEQADQLALLALANDPMYQNGKGTDPGTVNWSGVWDPAAKLLSREQLALLQRTVEVWALQKQVALHFKAQPANR